MKTKSLRFAICLAAALAGAFGLEAAPFVESRDAGITERSAVVLPPGVNGVNGTLQVGYLDAFSAIPTDVDVFSFTLDKTVTGASITASVAGGNANLLLLKEGFFGIQGDDDGGPGFDSNITRDLGPGTYYIAVGLDNIAAFEASAVAVGDDLWANDSNSLTLAESTAPIAFIGSEDPFPSQTTGESYAITFNFVTAVTGLDQSAGARFSRLRGANVLNGTGRGQTVNIRGKNFGKFVIIVKNTAFDRIVKSTLPGHFSNVNFSVIAVKDGSKNITAQLKSRRYRTTMTSGSSVRYNFKVKRGTAPLRRNFLLRSRDTANTMFADVAGAKVNLR